MRSGQKERVRQFGIAALLGFLFALAYTQSPLYTSNQNQYFLHGLAQAGYGYLAEDWLANTLDPTPVFSALVYLTYKVSRLPALFYLYEALLLGIYLYCLAGIAERCFNLRRFSSRWWIFLALIFLVHSTALRFTFSRAFGDNWTYLLEDGLADQRLLGPVLQPSVFGVLLLVSIYQFLQHRPLLAVLSAVLAAAFHPTYLLSSGSLVLAYMLVTYHEERRFRPALALGLLALLGVAPILIYVYLSFGSAPAVAAAKAQAILVNFRIPFHALASRWFDMTALVKLAAILAGIFLTRRTRIFWILLIPFLVGSFLTVLQVVTREDTLALLFPWRISTFLVPLCVALLLAAGVTALFWRFPNWESHQARWPRILAWCLIGALVIGGIFRFAFDIQRQAAAPDRPLMAYVAAHNAPGEYYLTPLDMQDFRLVTGSPVYVEFKSIPYQAGDVLEWERRIQTADLFYKKGDCTWIEKLAKIGLTHVIIPAKLYDLDCIEWEQLYQDTNFALFRLK